MNLKKMASFGIDDVLHPKLTKSELRELKAAGYRQRYLEGLIEDGQDPDEINEQMMICEQSSLFEKKAALLDE